MKSGSKLFVLILFFSFSATFFFSSQQVYAQTCERGGLLQSCERCSVDGQWLYDENCGQSYPCSKVSLTVDDARWCTGGSYPRAKVGCYDTATVEAKYIYDGSWSRADPKLATKHQACGLGYQCEGGECKPKTPCDQFKNSGECTQKNCQWCNNACVDPTFKCGTCFDSDSGKNKDVRGYCTDASGKHYDSCPQTGGVREWYCPSPNGACETVDMDCGGDIACGFEPNEGAKCLTGGVTRTLCSNEIDDDKDGKTDYPSDDGCKSEEDKTECYDIGDTVPKTYGGINAFRQCCSNEIDWVSWKCIPSEGGGDTTPEPQRCYQIKGTGDCQARSDCEWCLTGYCTDRLREGSNCPTDYCVDAAPTSGVRFG